MPSAEAELQELKNMNCDEITARNSLGSYWTPDNGKFARDKVDACVSVKTLPSTQKIIEIPKFVELKTKPIIFETIQLEFPKGVISLEEFHFETITVLMGINNTDTWINQDACDGGC